MAVICKNKYINTYLHTVHTHCTYIHTYMHACMHTYIHVFVDIEHVNMYLCIYACRSEPFGHNRILQMSVYSGSEWEAPPRRTQSYPPNPYTQGYNGTVPQWRKRLYILRGRSTSAPAVCAVRYPRLMPPRVNPGSAWIRSATEQTNTYQGVPEDMRR